MIVPIGFVPSGNYADVIKSLYPDAEKPGDIVHVDGRQLGRHEGIINYTIGQRRGLGIASGERLFVVSIEPANNRIIIGSRSELTTRIINIRDINWLGDAPLSAINDSGLDIFARVRSTRPPVPAIIRRHDNDDDFSVTLEVPEGGIAPGQACVFYDSDAPQARILGGGWISGNVSGKKPFKSAINAAGSAAVASQA